MATLMCPTHSYFFRNPAELFGLAPVIFLTIVPFTQVIEDFLYVPHENQDR